MSNHLTQLPIFPKKGIDKEPPVNAQRIGEQTYAHKLCTIISIPTFNNIKIGDKQGDVNNWSSNKNFCVKSTKTCLRSCVKLCPLNKNKKSNASFGVENKSDICHFWHKSIRSECKRETCTTYGKKVPCTKYLIDGGTILQRTSYKNKNGSNFSLFLQQNVTHSLSPCVVFLPEVLLPVKEGQPFTYT